MIRNITGVVLWICSIFIITFILVSLTPVISVSAEGEQPPPNDEYCRSCHENRYLLYDTGKYYCLCAMRAHCSDCHNGNPDANTADAAHEGMIANPVNDNPEVCQSCHPQDADTKIEQFTLIAGVQPTATPIPNAPHTASLVKPSADEIITPLLMAESFQPWKVVTLVAILIAAVGFCYFVHCLPDQDHSTETR